MIILQYFLVKAGAGDNNKNVEIAQFYHFTWIYKTFEKVNQLTPNFIALVTITVF